MLSFVVTAIITITIGLFGIFGNINILVAVYRLKPRMRASLLIAILAFSDLFCIVSEFQNATRQLIGMQSYRRECFWAISPYLVMIVFQSYLMSALAFDRLYALAFPVRYQRGSNVLYAFVLCLPGSLCGMAVLLYGSLDLDNSPIAACNPPLAFPSFASEIWNKVMMVSLLLTLVGYGSAFVMLFVKRRHMRNLSPTDPNYAIVRAQHRVTKTLGVMTVAFMFSGFLGHMSAYIIYWFGLSDKAAQFYMSFLVIPVMMCYTQNFYIYYCCSKTYRNAFIDQFRQAAKCESQKTRVHTLNYRQSEASP
ncbi:hypothetical protein QR680_011459 [Steinernema hermaphroditum]|uniref:G-protein coupled receptors family 1 profile domain-containing protein n=1 Tax=Steinernema hermaphroditum TaxID=289476 RepID=A0AA39HYJ9_9BILA|nr:hypothetical protein QR680_011459 [Steinernema hermaphroditum]